MMRWALGSVAVIGIVLGSAGCPEPSSGPVATATATATAPATASAPASASASASAPASASASAPASAPASASASAAPRPAGSAAPSAAVAEKIKKTFGTQCHLERTCGALWGVDCESAVDGPYYYVKPDTLEVVSRCGGYCMGGRCTNCPPKEWSCKTY